MPNPLQNQFFVADQTSAKDLQHRHIHNAILPPPKQQGGLFYAGEAVINHLLRCKIGLAAISDVGKYFLVRARCLMLILA